MKYTLSYSYTDTVTELLSVLTLLTLITMKPSGQFHMEN